MIKQGLKNYFKSLRHFFTPLGTMFLGIMLGLSVAAADTVAAASALTEGIKSLADNINLDFKNLLDGIWLQITALDWENNPASAIQTLFSAEWLNGVLSSTLQALLGTDFDTFTQEITLLVTTFTSRIAANIAVFFTFCNPHHPSDRLYHLYLRISRRKEHNCIQRRDIYSFTEATDIR